MIPGESARRAGLAARASPLSIRVELRAVDSGDTTGPLDPSGEVLVTCVEGAFVLRENDERMEVLLSGEQTLVPEGSVVELDCYVEGVVELAWSPPRAAR